MKEPKVTWINKHALVRKKIEVDEIIPHEVGKAFVGLRKQGKIPGWVETMTDVESMELAAIDG